MTLHEQKALSQAMLFRMALLTDYSPVDLAEATRRFFLSLYPAGSF